MSEAQGAGAEDRADMERLVQGHDSALENLMSRHAPKLHLYLYRLLQNEADAEDLAQETFVRVHEHRERYDPRLTFSTWLYTIATNLVRDRFRWRSRHPESSLDQPIGPGAGSHSGNSGDATVADRIADPAADPAKTALAEERAEAVRRAVASLPEDLREPLVLAEFGEFSQKEIGTILACSAKAVEMRLYRGRQRLRELLVRWLKDQG